MAFIAREVLHIMALAWPQDGKCQSMPPGRDLGNKTQLGSQCSLTRCATDTRFLHGITARRSIRVSQA